MIPAAAISSAFGLDQYILLPFGFNYSSAFFHLVVNNLVEDSDRVEFYLGDGVVALILRGKSIIFGHHFLSNICFDIVSMTVVGLHTRYVLFCLCSTFVSLRFRIVLTARHLLPWFSFACLVTSVLRRHHTNIQYITRIQFSARLFSILSTEGTLSIAVSESARGRITDVF